MEVNCYLQSTFQVSSNKRFSVSIKKLWSKLQPVSNQCTVPQNAQDNQLLNAVRWEIFWRITSGENTFLFLMWTSSSAALRSREEMQPLPVLCPQPGIHHPKHTEPQRPLQSDLSHSETPQGWMGLAWGAGIKNIKCEIIPVSHLPARSADSSEEPQRAGTVGEE